MADSKATGSLRTLTALDEGHSRAASATLHALIAGSSRGGKVSSPIVVSACVTLGKGLVTLSSSVSGSGLRPGS